MTDHQIDFSQLGQDFFRVYFGEASDVSLTDLARVLGGREMRRWSAVFSAWVEMKKLPFVTKGGYMRVTPSLLTAWFEREMHWRQSDRMLKQRSK